MLVLGFTVLPNTFMVLKSVCVSSLLVGPRSVDLRSRVRRGRDTALDVGEV